MLNFANPYIEWATKGVVTFLKAKTVYGIGNSVADTASNVATERLLNIPRVATPQPAVQQTLPQSIVTEASLLGFEAGYTVLAGLLGTSEVTHAGVARVATSGFRCLSSQMDVNEYYSEVLAETLSHMAATYVRSSYKTAVGESAEEYSDFTDGLVYGTTKAIAKTILSNPQRSAIVGVQCLQATGNGMLQMYDTAKSIMSAINAENEMDQNNMDEGLVPYGMFGI